MIDIVIIVVIVLVIFAVIRNELKKFRRGGGCNCTGCGGSCTRCSSDKNSGNT